MPKFVKERLVGIITIILAIAGAIFGSVSAINYQKNLSGLQNPPGYPLQSFVQPVITPAIPTTTGSNLVLDTSFETYPANWANAPIVGAPVVSVTTSAHTGAQAIQITGTVNDISDVNSDVISGLTPGAQYLVSFWGKTITGQDGVPTAIITNDLPNTSTQIYSVASSTWITSAFITIFGGNPSAYLVQNAITSTSFAQKQQVITAPANGKVVLNLVNAPDQGAGVADVVFDDVAIQSYTPGIATTTSDITLFQFNNPADASLLTASSSVFKFTTTGGTPHTWMWLLSNGQIAYSSPNGLICGYTGVSNSGVQTNSTSTCPTY